MDTRKKGKWGEDLAIRYLLNIGCEIVARNYRLRDSEIDIIFKEKENDVSFISEYLVFAEVKYRNSALHGYGYEAVDAVKIAKISKAARYFLYTNHYSQDTPVRFDVISINGDKIDHFRNAFDISG